MNVHAGAGKGWQKIGIAEENWRVHDWPGLLNITPTTAFVQQQIH
jgi:hypothetical protein